MYEIIRINWIIQWINNWMNKHKISFVIQINERTHKHTNTKSQSINQSINQTINQSKQANVPSSVSTIRILSLVTNSIRMWLLIGSFIGFASNISVTFIFNGELFVNHNSNVLDWFLVVIKPKSKRDGTARKPPINNQSIKSMNEWMNEWINEWINE